MGDQNHNEQESRLVSLEVYQSRSLLFKHILHCPPLQSTTIFHACCTGLLALLTPPVSNYIGTKDPVLIQCLAVSISCPKRHLIIQYARSKLATKSSTKPPHIVDLSLFDLCLIFRFPFSLIISSTTTSLTSLVTPRLSVVLLFLFR